MDLKRFFDFCASCLALTVVLVALSAFPGSVVSTYEGDCDR